MCVCVCVYSNSRIDVSRVAKPYGTIAAQIRSSASVLDMFVVFCMHMYSFAGLIWRTPPPTLSDTAITDLHRYHYFPAQSSLGVDILVYWIRKIVCICALGGSRALNFACRASTLSTKPGSPHKYHIKFFNIFISGS